MMTNTYRFSLKVAGLDRADPAHLGGPDRVLVTAHLEGHGWLEFLVPIDDAPTIEQNLSIEVTP